MSTPAITSYIQTGHDGCTGTTALRIRAGENPAHYIIYFGVTK